MKNKTRIILLIVLLLVVAVIGSRPLWQGEGASGKTDVSGQNSRDSADRSGKQGVSPQQSNDKASPGPSLVEMVNGALGKDKPAVLVFTYNADCCESTKEFFEKHRVIVKSLEQKYSSKVNFVWIDVALYNEVNKEELISIAKKYGVTAIPALVLIDSKGKLAPLILGELNEKATADKLEGLVKGQ